MFDWNNIPPNYWERSVPSQLREAIRDCRADFAEFFDTTANNLVRASASSFQKRRDKTLQKIAIFDLRTAKKGLTDEELERFYNLAALKYSAGIFAAYFELISASASLRILAFFRSLLEIGKDHVDKLPSEYTVWAERQSVNLVYGQLNTFLLFVVDVCEQGQQFGEAPFGFYVSYQNAIDRGWRAPSFLEMRPSPGAYRAYSAGQALKRLDLKQTNLVSNTLANRFFQKLSDSVKRAAKDYRLEVALSPSQRPKTVASSRAGEVRSATDRATRSKPVKLSRIRDKKRTKVIFAALEANYSQEDYASFLTQKRLPLPQGWVKGQKSLTYEQAYDDHELRQKIHDERSKYKIKFNLMSKGDRSCAIAGDFDH